MARRNKKPADPKRSRALPRVLERYFGWNFHQWGKSVSAQRGYSFWYRDDVLFANEVPAARLLIDKNGDWLIALSDYSTQRWYVSTMLTRHFNASNRIIETDNLGVFGTMGCKLENAAFIAVLQQQLEDKGRHMIASATSMPGPNAGDAIKVIEADGRYYGRTSYHIDRCKHLAAQYIQLSRFIGRESRSELLDTAGETILAELRKRAAAYTDPARVKRRERARARREAAQALTEGAKP